MKTRYIIASLLIAASGLTSCNSFLDIDPTDQASDKLVWSNTKYAELAINYFYADIPYLGSFSSYQCLAGLTEGLTDEFKYGNMNYNAECYIPNEISYGGIVLTPSYTDTYMGVWETTYEEIRRVNEALSKLKSSSFDESVKKQYEGELRFFRGMYYFELLKRYGQAIIYDDDLSKITTDHALDTADDCWNYVYDDLLYAGQNLPNSTTNNGRLTSGAAYALMSRAMLYCKNWKAVKEAAEAVTSMGYKLTANYADAFKASGNTEAIYMYSYSADASVTHNFDGYYAPGGDHKKAGMTMYGGYGTPTQDMVEEYEKADGSKVDWSTWHTTEGTLENPPYDELEPRFQATILYNGASWRKRTIEPYVDGTDGWATWKTDAVTEGRTTTGYYLRKLVDENHDFSITQNSTQPWVAFRLAEVLLNEAEACHNLGDDTKAVELINQVRSRVGLPGIKSYSDEALRHERKVELAYEGLYYWDMRRWGLATSAFTGIRRHGLKIEKLAEGKFRYTYVDVDDENLNYPAKMNRLPIPEKELNNNKDIEQFSEWK
jgi:hypothetical protein